ALVLERRFPTLLGDRLITAVELADPKQAAQLGYSAPMVEKTIQEAGEKVQSLFVAEVFDWQRLKRLWLAVAALVVGVFVVVGAAACGLSAVLGGSGAPMDFLAGFADVAAIWTERNVLLMDSYWPRRAHLEVVRFQDTPSHPGEMRIGRDEQRPELTIRAVQWVVADRQAPDGWRALRWADLPRFLSQELLERVAIPSDYDGWVLDLEELPKEVPASMIDDAWKGKTFAAVGPELRKLPMLDQQALARLLDWREWTLDRLKIQDERPEVRQPLRARHFEAHKALEEVFAQLEELAGSRRYRRQLRKLEVPATVTVDYRGESTRTLTPCELRSDQRYGFDLNELKESGRFRIRGADYWTKPLRIELVPPPAVTAVFVDKEEPAYLYYRLQGSQAPLKGKRQLIENYPVSASGDTTSFDVPHGTSLTLRAEVDRKLKEGIALAPFGPSGVKDSGGVMPKTKVQRAADGKGYSLRLDNITATLEFSVECHDEDNVYGRRKYRIRPVDDQAPEINAVELAVVLRKPRFKTEPGKSGGGVAIDGYLITPDALLPLLGGLRDDHGLARCEWVFETELVDFQLSSAAADPTKDRSGLVLSQGNSRVRRSGLIATGLQYHPAALQPAAAMAYWAWVGRLFEAAKKYQTSSGEERAAMEAFEQRLKERALEEIPLSTLAERLTRRPAAPRGRLKEHQLKEEEGFDLRRHLARLKTRDPIKEPQQLYFLRLGVAATDNNVETGPSTTRLKAPFFFLVVSENDLLAQVAIEEEVLGERLEKVLEKVANARTSVLDQIQRLPAATDANLLTLSAIRADEVRKAVLDGASVTRELHADFTRILRELEVNRVQQAKRDEVRTKVVGPLDFIINPNFGSFQTTEEAAHRFYEALDREATEKRPPSTSLHLDHAKQLREQLDKLYEDLNQVAIAISQGVTEARNFESLVFIRDRESELAKRFDDFHKRRLQEILEELTGPKKK
ncbi:MAG: hypothetical protein NZO58_02960, partial [Gemmataceae bacterium]|nr:hypothetical protein [Gemmataceae bacterium]